MEESKPLDQEDVANLFAEVEQRLGTADDEALDELKVRFDDMQDQLDRLTRLKLEGINYAPGLLDIKVSMELCRVLAAHFWNILEQAEAQNYVEIHFADQSKGRTAALEFNSPDMIEKITVLIQRSLGKTPHQLRREAEERYEALRFGFATVAQLLIDAVAGAEVSDAMVTAQVEAVNVALTHNITLTIPRDPSTIAAEAENGDDGGGGGGGSDSDVRSDGEGGAEEGGRDAGGLGDAARADDGRLAGQNLETDDRGPGVEAPGGSGPGDDRQPEDARSASAEEAGGREEAGVPPGGEGAP